ncbi:recombinase family protein [Synechococcus elongatus]|uniref:recombinase family protein n=1 Tax=Synechococcus elongatus TaxID=32046 RepID=UPI000F7DEA5C|nr:recombinase family protein [Synechococcus elongatus]
MVDTQAAPVATEQPQGQRLGYIRVSSLTQNTDRQEEALNALGLSRVFTDKLSGKDTDRPALQALLDYAREGDSVYVHSLDRLARNLDDLRKLVQQLTSKGVQVHFLKEGLSFTGEDSPMSQLLLSVLGAFSEFERSLIRERQMEGIAIAKAAGKYRGRKRVLTPVQVEELKRRVASGEKKAPLAREFGITRETLYQYLK